MTEWWLGGYLGNPVVQMSDGWVVDLGGSGGGVRERIPGQVCEGSVCTKCSQQRRMRHDRVAQNRQCTEVWWSKGGGASRGAVHPLWPSHSLPVSSPTPLVHAAAGAWLALNRTQCGAQRCTSAAQSCCSRWRVRSAHSTSPARCAGAD